MKLRRIKLESFKRFSGSYEIAGLQDGLNLFYAPNEQGKSTITTALKAAFHERHRSNVGDEYKSWSDSSGSPSVEIDFEISGEPARLLKRFAARKTCELRIGGRTWDGAEAEEHLAELLGFRFASKGGSTEEHRGIPGLLWVEQGTSQRLEKLVESASSHIRNALGDTLGELAATAGDAVIRKIEAERNELLTVSKDSPRGVLAAAIETQATTEALLEELTTEIQGYQSGVDQLSRLRQEHARDENEKPWIALGDSLQKARADLETASGLKEAEQNKTTEIKRAKAMADAVRSQIQTMEAEQEQLVKREAAVITASEALEDAKADQERFLGQQTQAVGALEAAQSALAAASKARKGLELQRALELAKAEIKGHEERITAAGEQLGLQTAAHSAWSSLQVDPEVHAELKRLVQSIAVLEGKLESVSTTLSYELVEGADVQAAGTKLAGSGSLMLASGTELSIAAVGKFQITPGGQELAKLAGERANKRATLETALGQLGLATLAEVDERVRLAGLKKLEVEAAKGVLKGLAPNGVEALEVLRAGAEGRRSDIEAQILVLGQVEQEAATVDPVEAETALQSADAAHKAAVDKVNDSKVLFAQAQGTLTSATQERDALASTLQDPARSGRAKQLADDLIDARARETQLDGELKGIKELLGKVNLTTLKNDVVRYERSVNAALEVHRNRDREIQRLSAQLEVQGATGLEERLAETNRDLEAARRRTDELWRRARCLDHLYKLLVAKRASVAERLRAPLQQRLNHYLEMLFPGARLEIDEKLAPERLTRSQGSAVEQGAFGEFSMGAREQLGIAARLAYADLLQEAGKPTLIILDDALVHTDDDRLAVMKRILFDAGTRHQIVVFTCHPSAWRDLGVPARALAP